MEGYTTDKENLHIFRGELALALAVIINSFGVVLMLHSGAGISAISSVPYAFSEVIRKYRSERGHIFFKDCLF